MAQPHAPERTASGYPRMTYEEFLALPDDLHAEWVDGEVCVM
ncbi:MAG: Uma2 family endonuclease, partial [Dehalococcoidia bacterium]|nr:Uma2 family endonuclease [Dehalococcoidia bacterium]